MFTNPFSSKRGKPVPASPNLVPRSTISIRAQRGWSTYPHGWQGPYATRYGTYNGMIERRGGILHPYIHNPCPELRSHPKWVCFHEDRRPGWWRIHLHTQPKDGSIDSVILYVERLITEAFNL